MVDKIVVIGTIGNDPTLSAINSENNVCNFSLVTNEYKRDIDKVSWKETNANWYRVSVYGPTATNAAASLSKGDRVIVSGKVRIKRWENEKGPGSSMDIHADHVGHSLKWGVSSFTRSNNKEAHNEFSNEAAVNQSSDWHQIGDESSTSSNESWQSAPF